MVRKDLHPLFKVYKPLIGMIHLAGDSQKEIDERVLREMEVFEEEGVDGVIVENYHGDEEAVIRTLSNLQKRGTSLITGLNILPNEFTRAFMYAHKYGAKFIQLDYVAGNYKERGQLDLSSYILAREKHPDIAVLGGVWPKYYYPVQGSNLEKDVLEGTSRADAIVVTGNATGMETPLIKINKFREIMGGGHLFVGAGLNSRNAYEQMQVCDGAIVGSYFKFDGLTFEDVRRENVRALVAIFREVRKAKK